MGSGAEGFALAWCLWAEPPGHIFHLFYICEWKEPARLGSFWPCQYCFLKIVVDFKPVSPEVVTLRPASFLQSLLHNKLEQSAGSVR